MLKKRLKIVLDARYIQDHFPGIGRYTYNMVRAMVSLPDAPDLTLVYNPALPNKRYTVAGLAENFPERVQLYRTNARPFTPAEQWQFFGLARSGNFDLWHAPYYIRPYVLPIPSVLTVYDVTSARLPDSLTSRKTRLLFEVATRLAFQSSDRIVAISQAAARDIINFYGVKPSKVSVTPLATADSFHTLTQFEKEAAREQLKLPKHYILYMGINKPHKNLMRLLDAFKMYHEQNQNEIKLVLAGKEDPRYSEALHNHAHALGLANKVIFWRDVPEDDLPKIYGCADLFVFPSLQEGFGLPVLEAMACGVPVACADNSSLPEVAGTAGVLFRGEDTLAIAGAIATGLERADELRVKSLAQAKLFSWQRTAEITLEVYKELVAKTNR